MAWPAQVCFTERGGVRQEEWVELERTQFVWLTASTGGPNPTFHPAKMPQGDAAISHRVSAAASAGLLHVCPAAVPAACCRQLSWGWPEPLTARAARPTLRI